MNGDVHCINYKLVFAKLAKEAITKGGLMIFTITTNTSDHGSAFIVRPHTAKINGTTETHPLCAEADSLDTARNFLPPHLTNIGRMDGDHPSIVESWF